MLSLGSISASRGGLFAVDQLTGAASLIGDTGPQYGCDGGLVFAPGAPVPEPITLATVGLGLAMLSRR